MPHFHQNFPLRAEALEIIDSATEAVDTPDMAETDLVSPPLVFPREVLPPPVAAACARRRAVVGTELSAVPVARLDRWLCDCSSFQTIQS
jgi:hypothetical protein